MRYDLRAVVMGVSAGGFNALHTILPLFPESFLPPVIIVQHRLPESDDFFVQSLNRVCKLPVREPEDKEQIQPGTVYIAPPEYHLLLEKDFVFSLSVDEPVSYARPSIDVLFETASDLYGTALAGVILTGANMDGTNGILKIKGAGGLTLAQDPRTAEVNVMPRSAISTDAVDFILPLHGIPPLLVKLLEKP